MIDGGQIIKRVRIVGVHGQRPQIILARLLKGEQVMVSDTDLVPEDGGGLRIAPVGLDRSHVAVMHHEQIAFNLGRERCGRLGGRHFGG